MHFYKMICSKKAAYVVPTLSVSAMKNMLSSVVDTSKACGLLRMSSAPLIERQRLTCKDSQLNVQYGIMHARVHESGAKTMTLYTMSPCDMLCIQQP